MRLAVDKWSARRRSVTHGSAPSDAGPRAMRGSGAQPTLKLAACLRLSRSLRHGCHALMIDAYCRYKSSLTRSPARPGAAGRARFLASARPPSGTQDLQIATTPPPATTPHLPPGETR
jgi:hypothetical protein